MGENTPLIHRVAMAKRVAAKWLGENAAPEYRLAVFRGTLRDVRNLPDLLKSFRDGKARVASVPPIKDLGVQAEFDHVVLRSSDFDALTKLEAALQRYGCETTGIY